MPPKESNRRALFGLIDDGVKAKSETNKERLRRRRRNWKGFLSVSDDLLSQRDISELNHRGETYIYSPTISVVSEGIMYEIGLERVISSSGSELTTSLFARNLDSGLRINLFMVEQDSDDVLPYGTLLRTTSGRPPIDQEVERAYKAVQLLQKEITGRRKARTRLD